MDSSGRLDYQGRRLTPTEAAALRSAWECRCGLCLISHGIRHGSFRPAWHLPSIQSCHPPKYGCSPHRRMAMKGSAQLSLHCQGDLSTWTSCWVRARDHSLLVPSLRCAPLIELLRAAAACRLTILPCWSVTTLLVHILLCLSGSSSLSKCSTGDRSTCDQTSG